MKLIVGLGNPGEKYVNNRHNVGFIFVDHLLKTATDKAEGFEYDKYLQAETKEIRINAEQIVLVKPQTYMNKSGIAVRSCIDRYTINMAQDLIIVHDDLDIPLGKFKIQKGSGPKLHNGLESIEKTLRFKDFLRIRIGVDNRDPNNRIDGETYVLQDFLGTEIEILNTTLDKLLERLSAII